MSGIQTATIDTLRTNRSPLVVVFLLLSVSSLQADETPWEAIADDAVCVIRIKNPEVAVKRATEFAELVKNGWGDQIRTLFSTFGESISNPELTGVDRKSSWWFAAYPPVVNEEPTAVVLLPATDRKKLREAWRQNSRIVQLGGYLIYSTDDSAAEKTAARLEGKRHSITDSIDAESRALFERGELSIFINASALPNSGKSKTGAASRKVLPGKTLRAMREAPGDRMLQEVFAAAVEDWHSITLTAGIANDGIAIDGLVRLRSGAPTAGWLPISTPAAMPELAALPAGGLIYAGAVGEWTA